MNIYELHIQGGILFMGILSLLFLIMLAFGILGIVKKNTTWLKVSREIALLAFVWGIFGQVVGLFGAFQAIEVVGEVSPALLAGGLKISSYTTIYGFIIFIVGRLIQIAARFIMSKP